MVAASERVGAGTGTAATRALSALACVRQSNTFGWSVLVPPAQRVPSRSAASWSCAQMVSACLVTNALYLSARVVSARSIR